MPPKTKRRVIEYTFDVAFTLKSSNKDWTRIPIKRILKAMEQRLEYLKAHPLEAPEAFGQLDTSWH